MVSDSSKTGILSLIPDSKILSSQGDKTLTVYLFHMFPIVFMEKMGVHIDHILISMVLALVIYLVTNYMHSFRMVRCCICIIMEVLLRRSALQAS